MRWTATTRLCALIGMVSVAAGILSGAPTSAGAAADEQQYLVAGTDQASQRILVLDPSVENWNEANNSKALKWAWQPTAADGFTEPTPGWRLVDEAKLRYSRKYDTRLVLATASYGFVGLIRYPSGKRQWSVNADDGIAPLDNPHSAELLPDGNVAVAASTGGWLRVYTASQGANSQTYVQYNLPDAHGVQWDPETRMIWALGGHHIVALKYGGTPAQPTLTEVRSTELPSLWGHDLQPVYGNPDRFWVTTGSRVYQYSVSKDEFTTDYPDSDKLDRVGVKSVSTNPGTGQILQTRPKAGCATSWCTDTVEFFGPDTTRTRPGTQFYKARWWVAESR
ncbi:DUF6528 family protein [Actinopolymorpha alba]|uniref:DUF6528 family protein n=1 Tax=Actinopolymorpha alba TaxID=533267 RepID=UPI00039B3579|nr:DUF6528 family protein [Actinopolymorpha alba]